MSAVFISHDSDDTLSHFQQQQQQQEQNGRPGTATTGEQSSRYENVASSTSPIRRPCPQPLPSSDQNFSPRSSLTKNQLSPPQTPISLIHSIGGASSPTGSCLARAKVFYDRTPLRHFGPWLLLVCYALLGACIFYLLEAGNERRLFSNRRRDMEKLRNVTLLRLGRLKSLHHRQILLEFEENIIPLKQPDTLEWDFLGALFYVGTVYTTIGYGNITPRTKAGQALSIVYAIVGIPLVLAILNQTSKRLTRWLSQSWLGYRRRIRIRRGKMATEREMEEGKAGKGGQTAPQGDGEQQQMESRTIPVWLALGLVGGYICIIAAVFLLWERNWSFFTSFYFICISCLTIGLGDVVPDHPHMLILMFVFVILGLSCVSMLISVIQIKMEEWLFKMLIRMQKEYQKALDEAANEEERERIIAEMQAKEPWFMRELATLCVSDSQVAKLEAMAGQFDRAHNETNTRAVQTEDGEESAEEMLDERKGREGETTTFTFQAGDSIGQQESGRNSRIVEEEEEEEEESSSSHCRSADSVSDATSLPMDPASFAHPPSVSPQPKVHREVQTELKSFAEMAVGSDETPLQRCKHRGTQLRPANANKIVDTDGLVQRKSIGEGTEPFSTNSKEQQTDWGKRRRGTLKRADSIDMGDEDENDKGTQYSPLLVRHLSAQVEADICESETQTEIGDIWELGGMTPVEDEIVAEEGPSQQRERSESIVVAVGDAMEDLEMGITAPPREKKDLVIQTDDSYLRIARKLDQMRTAKSDVNIYCTGVGVPKQMMKRNKSIKAPNTDRRKSLRFLEPATHLFRESFRWHKDTHPNKHREKEKQQSKTAIAAEEEEEAGTSEKGEGRIEIEEDDEQQQSQADRRSDRKESRGSGGVSECEQRKQSTSASTTTTDRPKVKENRQIRRVRLAAPKMSQESQDE